MNCKFHFDDKLLLTKNLVSRIRTKLLLILPIALFLVVLVGTAANATTPPSISPSYRVFSSGPQTVTITATAGNSIFYTTNGTPPNTGSTPYTAPFPVSTTTTIEAVAYDGTTLSAITTSIVQIDPTTSTVPSSGLTCWYKADNGAILSSGSVTSWIDVSGSGSTASQTTSSAQPTYTSSAINGLPAVVFNGSSDYLNMPAGFSNFASGVSIFVVANPTATSPYYNNIFDFANTSNYGVSAMNLVQPSGTNLSFQLYDSGGNITSVTASSAVTTGSYKLFEVTHDGTATGTMYTNAVQIAQNTAMSSTSSLNPMYNFLASQVGGVSNFAGGIAEVLVYNRLLTSSQRLGVEQYLVGRYGFPPLPPSISPSYAVFASGPQTVTLTDAMPAAVIHYTTNGTTPTSLSPTYSAPFAVSSTTNVQAIAIVGSGTSSVTSTTIQIDPTTTNVSRTGLNLWLKSDLGVIQNSGSVTTWTDVSGNGLSATQPASPNAPPTLVSSAINGLPAIAFNGTTQCLQLPTGFSNFTAGETLFVMAKPTVFYNTGARFLDMGTGPGYANSLPLLQPAVSSLAFSVYGNPDTNVTTVTSGTGLTLNMYQLFEATHDGVSTATIYTNGVPLAQSTAMLAIPNVSRTLNYVGCSPLLTGLFEGQIAEILLYNQNLTTTQRQDVESYLLNRYYGQTAAAAPIFSLPTSTLAAPNQVAISGPPGSTIYFTVNGTTPTQSSPSYSGPIQINYTQTVSAISVVNGVSSSVASATYTLNSALYPAPSSSDTRPLTINLQLPATAQ
jgi:hypothetical protein